MGNDARTKRAKQYASTVVELPEPPTEFQLSDVAMTMAELLVLKNAGVVIKAEHRSEEFGHMWRVHQDAYQQAVNHYRSDRGFSCCSSRAVLNVDGELVCKRCGTPVSEEEYKRVMA